MRKNKRFILVIVVVIVLVITMQVGLGFLATGDKQSLANTFRSGCLNITIESVSNAIDLNKQIPITDIEGLKQEGYTFTIRNTCSKKTNYQINLESINKEANSLNADYVRVALASDNMDYIITNLSENKKVDNSTNDVYEAYNLYSGEIEGEATKEFILKEWLDYDTTVEQGASKVYKSKINVIAGDNFEIDREPVIQFTKSGLTLTGNITGEVNSVTYLSFRIF